MRLSIVSGLLVGIAPSCLALGNQQHAVKSPGSSFDSENLATGTGLVLKRRSAGAITDSTCATGVHMIVARASTEAPGQGIIGAVAAKVEQQVLGSDSEAVDYPATLTNYPNSEASGVAAMRSLVESYTGRCPESKIALLGYSQGAHVVGDIMCGATRAGFNTSEPLSASLTKNSTYLSPSSSAFLLTPGPVVAVVQMGDPTFVVGLSSNVGTATKSGISPRLNAASTCNASAAITKSYCDADDRFCSNGTSIPVHTGYVQEYGDAAAHFIMEKAMMMEDQNSNSTLDMATQNQKKSPAESMKSSVTFLLGVSILATLLLI